MMQDFSKLEKQVDFVLGQKIGVPTKYTPDILVRIPRSENRGLYQIDASIFTGKDVWHCFEVYMASESRALFFPLTIEYSSNSKYIVESKSLKLYLNSFNNPGWPDKGKYDLIRIIKKDLSKFLETMVSVYETTEERKGAHYLNSLSTTPTHLHTDRDNLVKIVFDKFRSKCKVTDQPDFATVLMSLEKPKKPFPMEFFPAHVTKVIENKMFSMRDKNHFHEECCELLFKYAQETFTPDNLTVNMNFTRRGGISICPVRSTTFSYNTFLWERE